MKKTVKVKICGITNAEDALCAVDAGCDALGFIFYGKSPRSVSPLKARAIIDGLPRSIVKVGVFVNAREQTVRRIARICRLDMLQFHGNESPAFCQRFVRQYKVIKVFRIKQRLRVDDVRRYKVFAYLFDTYSSRQQGGTGRVFNWRAMNDIAQFRCPIFLSGGLSGKNVRQAIRIVRPEWVDASSSLEASVGKKDRLKVKSFIRQAKSVIMRGYEKTTSR